MFQCFYEALFGDEMFAGLAHFRAPTSAEKARMWLAAALGLLLLASSGLPHPGNFPTQHFTSIRSKPLRCSAIHIPDVLKSAIPHKAATHRTPNISIGAERCAS